MAAADNLSFEGMGEEQTESPEVEGAEEQAEGSDIAEVLASYEPKDILQYLIDQGKLAPETSLLEEVAPAEGEMMSPTEGMPPEGAAPQGGGDMSFLGMM